METQTHSQWPDSPHADSPHADSPRVDGQYADDPFEIAQARGAAMMTHEPRATSAAYDRHTGRVEITLANMCSYNFPAHLVQDLSGASDDDLSLIEVDGMGFNLHFPRLNADLFVPALVSGLFGNKAWMTKELARRAGQVKSPAKAAAARANGAKGGRPRQSIAA